MEDEGITMLRLSHLIGILFAIIMMALTWASYKKRKLSLRGFASWSVIWVGFIIGVLLFDRLRAMAAWLDIRVFDFFVLIAILTMLALIFSIYKETKVNQRQITEIVESVARKQGTVMREKRQRER
ncbi:DUF2304 domain-containing protein [Candidatus Woesearchaeota archaeon]|nr:DUF2304 domain-containing protein [Candidatus Woesearchaeota archaeon]